MYFLKCKSKETYSPVHKYHFDMSCIKCKSEHQVSLNGSDLFKYHKGTYIQDAFSYISQGLREMMMSGICDKCFQDMFPKEDESECEIDLGDISTSRLHEVCEYYKIKKDSSQIKRVEELAMKLDVAVESGDTDKVTIIDSELTSIGVN